MTIKIATRFQIIFNTHARQTVGRWLAIYPSITLVLWELEPMKLPTWIIALIATLIVVPVVHYVVLPMVGRMAHPWVEIPALKGAAWHRMAFVLWCSTYPVITVLLYALLPWLQGWLPLPAVTFCITVIAVPAISYLVLPCVLKAVGSWVCRGA